MEFMAIFQCAEAICGGILLRHLFTHINLEMLLESGYASRLDTWQAWEAVSNAAQGIGRKQIVAAG